MTKTLTSLVRLSALLLGFLALWTVPAAAQDVTAEVRTWDGQSWRITQPSLEVFYTIPAPNRGGPDPYTAGPTGNTASGQLGPGSAALPVLSGSVGALQSYFEGGPEPRQGHRQADYITIRRGGVERQIPFASIASLTFARHLVTSTLPVFYANRHFRYTATVLLTDGSRVEADYINLGTLVLRGQTASGRLDLPWEEIQFVSFQR
ncbi:MAG TPA: hypothetical protein VJU81_01310 [Methylomirabilota bacterium]|nr:hypothetical protein [Methylomirabilota bacterium]